MLTLQTRQSHEPQSHPTPAHPWREALSSFNPVELWHAFQEAEDAVCLMAPHTSQYEHDED